MGYRPAYERYVIPNWPIVLNGLPEMRRSLELISVTDERSMSLGQCCRRRSCDTRALWKSNQGR